MGVMYLKEDHTGPASRTEYGRKGDKVEVLKTDRPLWLVQGRECKFFIQPDKLSEKPIQASPRPVEAKKKAKR